MSRLSPDQFARIEALFFEATPLPADQREPFLDRACPDDPRVRAEVLQLLRHATRGTDAPDAGGRGGLMLATGVTLAARAAPDARALVGTRIENYDVTAVLGMGGMGVVYRARDVRLGRQVAVKTLPPAFVSDPARLDRFMREARILASLSHPSIATVFDLAEHAGATFLVMELVEGDDLGDRLARGPMRIDEALAVCAAIAAALEAAHDAGVIHRDLKPHNVMTAADGKVKVLDFGLAREFGARSDADTTIHLHPHETREGAVLGTPGYMSPEQVRGQPADRRADVFALGCILYECLTGRVAFAGDTTADVAAGILEREPDWRALPPATPPLVRRLLARAVAKDPARRLRDMGDFRIELEEALAARDWLAPAPPPGAARRRSLLASAAPWLVASLVAAAAFLWPRRAGGPPAPAHAVKRFAVPFPGDGPQSDLARVRLAISRGGDQVVISAAAPATQPHAPAAPTRPQLWVRGRDEYAFHRLDGTENAFMPSFSPDAQWVIYHDDRLMMKKRIAGGNPVAITEVGGFWGAYHWGPDDLITYAPVWGKGLARIPAAGGKPHFITTVDYDRKEFAHVGPCVTPDNAAALFTVWNGAEDTRIEAVEFATGKRHYNVVERGSSPRVARTPAGHALLYEHNGNLFAAPFDVKTLRRTGPDVQIENGVMTDNVLFSAAYDVADDGTLVYVPGPLIVEEGRLATLNPADQTTTPFNNDRYAFGEPRFTADGQKLSVIAKGKMYRVHVYDARRESFDRVVTDGDVVSAAISPDGQTLAYSCNKDGPYTLWVQRLADGQARQVFAPRTSYQVQLAWSPDSRYIAFSMSSSLDEPRDVFYVDLQGTGEPVPFAATPGEERSPRFSPTGKWIAYNSNRSGTREVYLKSFPDGATTRQLTVGGGDWPEWAPDGKTLYYRAKGRLWAVPVNPDDGTTLGRPTVAYAGHFGQSDFELPDYTVDPQGRILLVEPSERGPKVHQINYVLNWWELMNRK